MFSTFSNIYDICLIKGIVILQNENDSSDKKISKISRQKPSLFWRIVSAKFLKLSWTYLEIKKW